MRIAVVGLDEPTREGLDPAQWDIVLGMAHDPEFWRFCTAAVEVHSREVCEDVLYKRFPDYPDRLATMAEHGTLYTPWGWGGSLGPNHHIVTYSDLGLDVPVESSVSYMLGLCLKLGASQVGLYGVDMVNGDEYGYQRPNAAYLVGLARGQGVDVWIHPKSRLLASEWERGCYGVGGERVQAPVQDREVASAA